MTAAGKYRSRRRTDAGGSAVALLAALLVPGVSAAANQGARAEAGGVTSAADEVQGWSSFRGPGGRGYALHADPPLAWSAKEGTNILWKTAVPTHGISSPVVWGKRLFLTGANPGGRRLYCYDTTPAGSCGSTK